MEEGQHKAKCNPLSIYIPSSKELRAARDEFRRLLGKRTRESTWQRFFTECPFVLSTSLPVRIAPNEIIPLGRPGRSEPDFVFYPTQVGTHRSYGVIELKRPDSVILTNPRKDIVTVSRDVATALAQAQTYALRLRRELAKTHGHHMFFGNPSQIFLIMGLSEELAETFLKELEQHVLNGVLPNNCHLIPYDTLLLSFEKAVPPGIVALGVLEPAQPRDPSGDFGTSDRQKELHHFIVEHECPKCRSAKISRELVKMELNDLSIAWMCATCNYIAFQHEDDPYPNPYI